MVQNKKVNNSPIWGGRNSLNLVRLLAALNVLYGHTITHLNIEIPSFVSAFVYFFNGVPIFFTISGFLIWGSISRSRNYSEYLRKRFWRIYPELWIAVIVEIVTLLLLYDHSLDWPQFFAFCFGQLTIFQFWTPDCLRDYGCGCPNGALWTICVLIQFYILAYPLHRCLHDKKLSHWFFCIIISICISIIIPISSQYMSESIGKLIGMTILQYLWMFLIAAFVAEKKEIVLKHTKRYWYCFIVALLILGHFQCDVRVPYGLLGTTILFLGLLGGAYAMPWLNVKTDISYGVYIYHMTIINALITLGYSPNVWLLAFVIILTSIFAWISTKTVGEWSLRKKNRQCSWL